MAKKIQFKESENFGANFYGSNMPVQMWAGDEPGDTIRVVNYMARKEHCGELEVETREEAAIVCRNSAALLRNLADLFEAFADGKIDVVYYPDESVSDAIRDAKKDRSKAKSV